jgi:hypothetical protein
VRLDACGYVLSCLALNGAASQGPNSRGTCLVVEPPERGCRVPGCVPSWGVRIRLTELIGGKILPTRGYRDGGKDWHRLLPGLVLFRLVIPPLQPKVMGPYVIHGTWFPSHLLLEGTGPYSDFWVITSGPWYSGYKTLTPLLTLPLLYDLEINTCVYEGLPHVVCPTLLRFRNEGPSCNAKVSQTHAPLAPCGSQVDDVSFLAQLSKTTPYGIPNS